MKIQITMKDPDTLGDSIDEVMKELKIEGLKDDEMKLIRMDRAKDIREWAIKNWFEYGEYLTVEIDTDAGTCTVVSR